MARTPSQLQISTLMLDPNHKAQLRELAKQGPGQSASGLVRLAIAQYLQRVSKRKR
jgi:hypothetical protein